MKWKTNTLRLAVTAALIKPVLGIGQDTCVQFKTSASAFPIVANGKATPLLVSVDDWPGVHIAASSFATDIQQVTGTKPLLSNVTSTPDSLSGQVVIVGTLGHSSLIDNVVNATGLDVSAISGKWEAFMALQVANPLPGVDQAYVIIGADKRGTIYALFDHSEQFGVSPWYWWADVPITKHQELFVTSSGCSHGSPTVKYRGIFLNDEQPALQNWAFEKFTNGTSPSVTGSPFNHVFYSRLFDLLLRLKANYLWPAIWSSAFAIDDPINQLTADTYGIAMGTSHQEPMMRSTPIEWNLFGSGPWNYTSNAANVYQYWVEGTERAKPYESVFTLGMRGAGDLPLDVFTNIDLLTKVINDQRQILTDVFNGTDITTIPQIWALYKEVEGYYIAGLKVPDDVILLWSDDNWGNVHRYPTADERNRTGGAGVYYHLDYVGDPRDYKWITTTQIPKVYDQMSIAVERSATSLWILNVGDLKPYERETEFFINYGWNATRWNVNNLNTFISSWAGREFDLNSEDSDTVTQIVANLTRYNARKKPEGLNGTMYSLVNYREADRVLAEWDTLEKASTKLYDSLPAGTKPAFFQLVQHPVTAAANLGRMHISIGKNNLFASQARLSTNALADQAVGLFEKDYDIETQYHTMLDGKWDHMMDQTHINYYYWQQPMMNSLPPVDRVQSRKQALAGVMRVSVENNNGAWPGDNPFQCDAGFNCPPPTVTLDSFSPFQNKYFDIGAGGPNSFTFKIVSNSSWASVNTTSGSITAKDPEQRVLVSVDQWDDLAVGANTAILTVTATASGQPDLPLNVTFVAIKNAAPPAEFKGFVEGDGVVSIEAAHTSRNTSVAGVTWTELPDYGRTLSGVTPLPRMGNDGNNFTAGEGPSLEYDFFIFNTPTGNVNVTTFVSPSLNANGLDRPIGFAVQIDEQAPQTKYFVPFSAPGTLPIEWGGPGIPGFVSEGIVRVPTTFAAAPGAHTLKIWMVEPAVVVQKIVIDAGGLRQSYLGPPESVRML